MGQASARRRAPGCNGKAEGRKEADEDEALRLGNLLLKIITLSDSPNRALHQICPARLEARPC